VDLGDLMKNFARLLCATSVCAVVALSAPAFAQVTVYTDKAAFQAATSAVEYDFSSVDDGLQGGSYTLGPVSFATTGYFVRYDDAYGSPYTPYLGGYGSPLTISSANSALGFDFGSYGGDQTVNFTIGAFTGSFVAPFPNNTTFIGFVGAGPLTITLSNNNELDTIRAYVGTGAVPEPASWALMVGGFGMVGGAMRSRRKAAVSFG
jgi:hypothetical protein